MLQPARFYRRLKVLLYTSRVSLGGTGVAACSACLDLIQVVLVADGVPCTCLSFFLCLVDALPCACKRIVNVLNLSTPYVLPWVSAKLLATQQPEEDDMTSRYQGTWVTSAVPARTCEQCINISGDLGHCTQACASHLIG